MKLIRNFLLGVAALAALAVASIAPASAAATAQTTHAWLCIPSQAAGAANRRVSVPTTGGGNYVLNSEGCALVVGSDIGWFLTQGAFYGPNIFTLRQEGITASTTATTSTITLPAYAVIQNVILTETAGNAITGGIDLGDSASATTYASAVALGANATVVVTDAALTRLLANSGKPVADQVFVACHTNCNSGSVNITIIYSYW